MEPPTKNQIGKPFARLCPSFAAITCVLLGLRSAHERAGDSGTRGMRYGRAPFRVGQDRVSQGCNIVATGGATV